MRILAHGNTYIGRRKSCPGARNRKPYKAENSGGNIVFCTNCGSKLPEGARFCSTCGARVAEVFEVPEVEEKPAAFGFTEKAPDPEAVKPVEAPLKKRATFDWSNVIDEPKKKTIPDIKSPWEATGGVDEKELYAEMGPSTERSRTMSFIDVLKAEKEQQEAARTEVPAAEPAPEAPAAPEKRPFEYTEVLDPGFLEPEAPAAEEKEEKIPQLHFAPLYEDIDAPVVTPFDVPEEEEETIPAEEVQITETVQEEAPAAEEAEEAPAEEAEEPAAEIYIEETVEEEEAPAEEAVEEAPAAEEAEEAPAEEPEAPAAEPEEVLAFEEEPVKPRRGWFDLPDFLKPKEERRPFAAFTEEAPEEIPAAEEAVEEAPAAEPEAPAEEPVFEEPEFDDADAVMPAEEIHIETSEYIPEEAEEEAPEEDDIFEGDLYTNTEDEYLDISTERSAEPVRGDNDDAEEEDDDEDEPVDEDELFADMTENAPKHTGMTIAPPADKETEIEALKKRLAELMGTSWEPEAEAPAEEAPAAEEPAEQDYYFKDAEPAEEPAAETPAYEEYDHADFTQYEEPASTAAYEDEYLTEEPAAHEAEEAVEEASEEPAEETAGPYSYTYEHLILTPEEPVEEIPGADSKIIQAAAAAAPAVEEAAVEEPVAETPAEEPVVEEPVAEEPAVEDFYLMDEEPAEEEIIFRAHEPAVVEEEVEEAVEEPAVEAVEEVVEEPAAEPAAEEPAHKTIDDFLADILREGAAPAAATATAAAVAHAVEEPAPEAVEEPAVEAPQLTLEDLAPAAEEEAPAIVSAEDNTDQVVLTAEELEVPTFKEAPEAPALTLEDLAPAAEPAAEEAAEEAAEAPVAEAAEAPAPEKKETDALSIEELEQDLFGAPSSPEAEVEATKKIDKFYTLYRKNEEFQRLLDEEYNKLKAAGGPVPEPAIPDSDAAEVKHKKIEDATIYQDFDLEKEAAKLRAEQEKAAENAADAKEAADSAASAAAPAAVAAGTAVAAGAAAAVSKKEKKAAAKAARAAEKAAKKAESQNEYEEVEKGGGFLTVLAVIIAILLIILLGVILVLNFMPDSSIALRIDSIIENITSHFTAVDVMGKTLLL